MNIEYVWIYTVPGKHNEIDVYVCMTCGVSISAPRQVIDQVKKIHTDWHNKGN